MRSGWLAILIAVVCVCLGLSAEAQRQGGDPKTRALKNPVASTPASLKAGQAIYGQYCRQCHGLRGKGDGSLAPRNPRPADFTDDKWDHGSTDGELYTIILDGAPPRPDQKESEMKPMKGTLSPTQIWQVVNFIRTFGPKAAPPAPAKK